MARARSLALTSSLTPPDAAHPRLVCCERSANEIQTLIETPWSVAMLDFAFPETRGQRPADFETTLKFGIALSRLAAEGPAVHKLTLEVQHLLKPRSCYRDPDLIRRVFAKTADA
ncbi:MAG TPA: hypothetical protein VKR55_13435 [Bradyrhizobium sp.]|uniref:hypothetical protein n=1 Tax=Bradyrhizobium sp. TaxID=376 RepID=UPI002CCC1F5B|nr:hypothetical protein [Bradyrhizobium sp.]HLZ03135.1 hypothetical protein [Bradyrhizobium sp.]